MQKRIGSSRKNLIFFPHDTKSGFKRWGKRAKAKVTIPDSVNDFIQPDYISKSLFYKQRGVIDQVVDGNDIDCPEIESQSFFFRYSVGVN